MQIILTILVQQSNNPHSLGLFYYNFFKIQGISVKFLPKVDDHKLQVNILAIFILYFNYCKYYQSSTGVINQLRPLILHCE